MAKIGFIGTGIMGEPMAANLQKAGHQLFLSEHHGKAPQALIDCLRDYLNQLPSDHLPRLRVRCFCHNRAQFIAQRVEEIFDTAQNLLLGQGNHRYLLQVQLQVSLRGGGQGRVFGQQGGNQRLVAFGQAGQQRGLSLAGVFPLLPNVAWTSQGAIDLGELAERQLEARLRGELLEVFSVDKFPKMTDYVVPAGVRIADSARIRLGAYIGEGTTVMHEGFVNFNAGTEGPGMIEGRVSAGVFVGKGSDLGGGCSTMGTLSGGGNIVIKVGEGCLIGANAGIGIPLGDRNTVESGLYVTAGTKVALLDENNQLVKVVKARELAGQPDLLFRRNSETGAVECKTHKSAIELNEALHAHN